MRNKKSPAMWVKQSKSLTMVLSFQYNEVVQVIIKGEKR